MPWVVMCLSSKFDLLSNQSKIPYIFGSSFGILGLLFEPLSKHSQYVGFFVPKTFEMYLKIFKIDKIFSKIKGMSVVMLLLMCGVIGLAHVRGHYENESKDSNQKRVNQNQDRSVDKD